MASRKRSGAAASRAKNDGAASGGTGTRTGSARAGQQDAARGGRRQGGRTQTGRTQTGRTQTGRTQTGRPQNSQGQTGRAQNGQRDRGPGGRRPDARAQNGRPTRAQARAGGETTESLAAAPPVRRPPPRWFQLTTLGLSLAALGVSIYLTIVHYSSTNLLVCSASGTINCEKVVTSPQSMVFGVFPVAVLGLAFYVFMVAINTPWAWRSPLRLIWWARLGGIITGIGFVLYLLYAEFIQIRNICLWCTSVHAITFVLFVMLIFYATLGTATTSRAD
jgi:uncharacterized membrane protein